MSEKKKVEMLDISEARTIYEREGLTGIVAFLDFLIEEHKEGRRETHIVGICFDTHGVTKGEFSLEAATLLKQININNPLHYAFDEFCG